MTILDPKKRSTSTCVLCVAVALFLISGAAQGDTTLLAWDVADEDLWSVDSAVPITSTFIGGPNASFIAEIEFGNGIVYGANTGVNTDFHLINPDTGLIFDTITLAFPPEGNVLTSLEIVGDTLYAGLTTEGGQGAEPTYLSTVDLRTGFVTVVGPTGVNFPFGGLAYDGSSSTMYAISSGGGSATLYTIDMTSGTATAVGPVTLDAQPFLATALEFGGDGLLYTAPSLMDPLFGHLLTIDPMTGAAIDLGATGLTQGAVALTFAPPSTMVPDATLAAWDTSFEDLWTIDTAAPITSTFVGGGNTGILAEIEYRNGVIYGADTFVNTDFHMIDPATGLTFDTITLTFPPEGDVLTSLEFVGNTLYAGLTTEGSQGTQPTYLSTVDLGNGLVTVVGSTGIDFPFGGLAYDGSNSLMYAISSGGATPAMLYTIDLVSGAATTIAPVTLNGQPFKATALEFGGDGLLYTAPAFTDPFFGDLLTVDPMSGAATYLGPSGLDQGPVALTDLSVLFEDGFESGDTSAWSSTSPSP